MSDHLIAADDHTGYLRLALSCARQSPPKPTNYRVGAVLVDARTNAILATGFTLELPGNTHAEQCCFIKYATERHVTEDQLAEVLPPDTLLYTTMEPCTHRLSGQVPCVQRILATRRQGQGVSKVLVGVREPTTFVANNSAQALLSESGIQYEHVSGLEDEILQVATAGHEKST
ncbi:MAG: hypothetical protein M1817_005922 [Caeruleum heppii]|nr:MAG: hypothetical protein M1817_005922 [Caeruleum heppii]